MSDTSFIGSVLHNSARHGVTSGRSSRFKIIQLPDRLENADRAQRIRGEITDINNSGKICIHTDKGEIIAQRSGSSLPLSNGAKVDIIVERSNANETPHLQIREFSLPPLTQELEKPALKDSVYKNIAPSKPITVSDLTASNPIAVEYIPSQSYDQTFAQKPTASVLKNPFFENAVLTNLPILIDVNGTISTAALPYAVNSDPSFPLSTAYSFLLPHNEIGNIASPPGLTNQQNSFTRFQPFQADILFRLIAPKLISTPLESSITSDKNNSSFTLVNNVHILNVVPSQTYISKTTHPQDQDHVLAGQTKGVIEGFTRDKHFPIFRFIASDQPQDQAPRYALQVTVTDLSLGSVIEFQSVSNTILQNTASSQIPPISLTPSSAYPFTSFVLPGLWDNLNVLQNTLSQHLPTSGLHALHAVTPSASSPAQMGNSALFFLVAMRFGDVQGWIGQKGVDALKRTGNLDILNKVSSEFMSLSRLGGETSGQEWRLTNLPLMWQNEIHRVVVHYRHENSSGGDNEQKQSSSTRFVMDLNLSKIGKVQIDGIFRDRKNSSEKRLDVALRTTQSFSSSMKSEMRRIYKVALDEVAITGELSFQDKKEYWVHIHSDQSVYQKDV